MNGTALAETLGFCALSVALEALSASKAGRAWFEQLAQPKHALPLSVWYVIGGFYYLMAAIIGYRIFDRLANDHSSVVLGLWLLMLLINGLSNFLLFAYRSLRAFYMSIYPFAGIVAGLFLMLFQFDQTSAWVLFPYLVWILYDIYYFHRLWRSNNA